MEEIYDFEEAKKRAMAEAKKFGKTIIEIREDEEYWLFEAGIPGKKFFDNNSGSVYINKKNGTMKAFHLPNIENLKFLENSKIIYKIDK